MFEDLRSYIEACKGLDEVREIRGASWDLEIGAVVDPSREPSPVGAKASPCLRKFGHSCVPR